MLEKIKAFKKMVPGGTIETLASVSEGAVIVTATAEADGKVIGSTCRIYPVGVAITGLDVVEDLLLVLGVDIAATPETTGSDTVTNAATESEAPGVEPEGSGALPKQEPKAGHRRKGKNGTTPKDEPQVSADEAIASARAVVLEFLPEKTPPITICGLGGKTLGELQDGHPHLLRYLTQPGGKVYVSEEIASAASILCKK